MPPRQQRRPKAKAKLPPGQGARPNTDEVTSYRPMGTALTVEEIAQDKLTQIANENWSTAARAQSPPPAYKPELVADIYSTELGGKGAEPPKLKRIMLLEISQYLENYLWPHYSPGEASFEHVMSMVVMLNEKFRENVPAWEGFRDGMDKFGDFFLSVLRLKDALREQQGREMSQPERVQYLLFVINAFQSLEHEMVRKLVLSLVDLQLWHALSSSRRQLELALRRELADKWGRAAALARKKAGQPGFVPLEQRPVATFIPGLLDEFQATLDAIVPQPQADGPDVAMVEEIPGPPDGQALLYCERFLEFMIDLLSQLPTRRYVHVLLQDRAVLEKCKLCALYEHPQGHLFRQLVDLFDFYMNFPIDEFSGEPVSEEDVTAVHYDKILQLQRLFFKHWDKLRELALANCGTVEKRDVLRKHLAGLSLPELQRLVVKQLRLVKEDDRWASQPEFLQEVLLSRYQRRRFQTEVINEMPLYPTERVLWDENLVPSVHYTGETCLALPKLNLQFLTLHDYLLRNFNLFRLEATYEIREDIADVLQRVGATRDLDTDKTVFSGWARMALPIEGFHITEVRKPNVGENKPAAVTADIVIETKFLRGEVRGEWDELKQHDVLFLLTIRAPEQPEEAAAPRPDGSQPSPGEKYGLVHVRGCEVIEVKDEEGRLMNDFTGRVRREEWAPPQGFRRTVTAALDTAQYQADMNAMAAGGGEDLYGTFNLLVRRKPKENNFKAVLESIRDLMNQDAAVPYWLHNIFLGYGVPAAARYNNLAADPAVEMLRTVDFKDTFLDEEHLAEAFPGYQLQFVNNSGGPKPVRPYRITFPPFTPDESLAPRKGKRKRKDAELEPAAVEEEAPKTLVVESYTPPDPGPYPQDLPPQNTVRFTPVQVEAIKSGVQPGLTMVVGPPGTGKTDTAVQIMHVLYHNCPQQRTLVITHSNQALNDLFEKIIQRDVPARYLLRLGMGEQDLQSELDFSRVGRVNAMLQRRLELLAEVEKLARQFKVTEDVAYTCETAGYFWLLHVLSRWEKFVADCRQRKTAQCVQDLFPFKEYFSDAPQPLFKAESYEADMEKARGCFRHLKTMFQELEECRAFELLKGQADRVNYLMTKQAKIVAMTCTHAALKRREFLELGFQYDNLLMEESAQILEIETFIPMVLQVDEKPKDIDANGAITEAEGGSNYSRLKRVILIGDHNQLPPVVKNMAFQKYSHLDQPLFTRFIRLGTPYIQLNAQGRARPSLAKLYNWRYEQLGDLPNVLERPEYKLANPGFAHEYQFINVPDFQGRGESAPVPYFYQNLGEAEMVVTLFQYMRLLGYPAHRISILTTYNGQKALLQDVVEQRCARHPAFGRPAKVTTVDKYQGQQNDYILLSLVRTRAVGHVRDVRRLVVAMSRARLGLYVFGRRSLFENCYELQPTFKQLTARPDALELLPGEKYEHCIRPVDTDLPVVPLPVPGLAELGALVAGMTAQWEAAALQEADPSGRYQVPANQQVPGMVPMLE